MSLPLTVVDHLGNPVPLRADSSGGLATSGLVKQAVPDYPDSASLLASYGNFADVAPGDFVTLQAYSNGQKVVALSAGPLQTGESRVTLDVPVYQPCRLRIEASVIRNRQQFATLTLMSNGEDGVASPVPNPINIVSISQSNATGGAAYSGTAGTTVTLLLETALPQYPDPAAVYLSDWINITGLVDTRLNYQNATINFISADRRTITFGFSDESALPSLAIPVVTPTLGTAKVNFYNNMGGASDGVGFRFTGTTATSAAIISMFGDGDAQISGSLLGDHRITIASTAPQYLNGTMGNVEIKATSCFGIEVRPGHATVYDKANDALTTWTPRVVRTAVKPAYQRKLNARFRCYQPIGMSRPTDKLITIGKAGTTTATVTHSGTRVYQVGEVVGIYGVRDIANFPQTVGPVTAVLSPTQFQLVVGSAVTASSVGGTVSIINGGAAQPGIIGQHVQSVRQSPLETTWLEVVANGNWSGLNVGDYINLHGVIDGGGVDLQVDGAWEVANISTTTKLLKPIFDIFGVRVTPPMPALGTVAVNCGGSVILRTTLRSHDLLLEQLSENQVMIDGQGTTDVTKAIPVIPVGGTQAVSGTVTVNGTVASTQSGPYNVGLVSNTLVNDVASAAITSTATVAAITPGWGNAYQVNVVVTAVTGTSPTMDLRIEESDDNGTNWYTVYDFPRITANGIYRSPMLPMAGTRVRYVQTIGGTSPSFTRAINRQQANVNAMPQRQLFDRSIVLTTLNSTTPVLLARDCGNATQLVVNVGAITTTAPQLQLEGSDDLGATWYAIGTPLTAVASSTVQTTITNINAALLRARVSTAGVGVTAGYVLIKAHD